jgi:hypothetical protein
MGSSTATVVLFCACDIEVEYSTPSSSPFGCSLRSFLEVRVASTLQNGVASREYDICGYRRVIAALDEDRASERFFPQSETLMSFVNIVHLLALLYTASGGPSSHTNTIQ